jgi:hypothetical protein
VKLRERIAASRSRFGVLETVPRRPRGDQPVSGTPRLPGGR